MYWTNAKPSKEGWYFWRRRRNQNDPFRWLAFYAADETAAPDSLREFRYFADGVQVTPPKGGWWCEIEIRS